MIDDQTCAPIPFVKKIKQNSNLNYFNEKEKNKI